MIDISEDKIVIRHNKLLTQEEFDTIVEMCNEAYGKGIFTNPGYSEERFKKCNECFTTAYSGDRMIGEWTVYPINDEFTRHIYESNSMYDDSLPPDAVVRLSRDKINNLMAIDLIVVSEFRGKGITGKLMHGFAKFIREKQAEGYRFADKVIGYVITGGGWYVMKKYGATLHHAVDYPGAYLFELDIKTFIAIDEELNNE